MPLRRCRSGRRRSGSDEAHGGRLRDGQSGRGRDYAHDRPQRRDRPEPPRRRDVSRIDDQRPRRRRGREEKPPAPRATTARYSPSLAPTPRRDKSRDDSDEKRGERAAPLALCKGTGRRAMRAPRAPKPSCPDRQKRRRAAAATRRRDGRRAMRFLRAPKPSRPDREKSRRAPAAARHRQNRDASSFTRPQPPRARRRNKPCGARPLAPWRRHAFRDAPPATRRHIGHRRRHRNDRAPGTTAAAHLDRRRAAVRLARL